MQWDYKVIEVQSGLMKAPMLREMGDDGWEMCGVVQTIEGPSDLRHNWPDITAYYFKRERPRTMARF